MRTIKVQLAVECDACDLRVEATEEYPNTSHLERCTNESLTNMIRSAQLTAFGPEHYLCPACIKKFGEWADMAKKDATLYNKLERINSDECEGCEGSGAARDGQGGCPECEGTGFVPSNLPEHRGKKNCPECAKDEPSRAFANAKLSFPTPGGEG